ncbi:uncharacterized protein EpC_30190 [Erwinia pyrifoliae Ep1/96]|nr:hypothetical protein CPI84_03255 [Erwinia pyrifoliae]CAX56798.1 uncharacterized protein EpC_30190 [Erwinia pyrifoliae Ep1/96]
MLSREMLDWIWQHGWPGLLLVLAGIVVTALHAWLVKTDPVIFMRWLLNIRKQRLEKMLSLDYLEPNTRDLIALELKQHCHAKLTGIIEPRLQDAVILMSTRYHLRARYLRPWRSLLKECEGRIEFDTKWYRREWWFFTRINLPLATVTLTLMVYLFAQTFGWHALPLIMIANITVWWFPWLMLTSVPSPRLTAEMQAYLVRFNES